MFRWYPAKTVCRNFQTLDFRCLTKAADGDNGGIIDFYQMHTYCFDGAYSESAPMLHKNEAYDLDKPNVLGEYSEDGSCGWTIEDMQKWIYEGGYE